MACILILHLQLKNNFRVPEIYIEKKNGGTRYIKLIKDLTS